MPALLGRLEERYDPAIIVIACNTASTIALEWVRAALDLPVVGTVPAIKPAAALSKTRTIGVLGTEATVIQPYVDRLAAEFASDCTVIRHGSAELVELAEAKLRGEAADATAYRAILAGLLDRPGGEIRHGLVAEQPGQLAHQLSELLRLRRLVAQDGELVGDQRVLADVEGHRRRF